MLNRFIKKLDEEGEIYLKIKVRPGASKNELKDILDDDTLKIDISAQPLKGKANQELILFLSKEFYIRKKNIKIISGAKDKIKLIKLIK